MATCKELKASTGSVQATSFKHVSPTGAAGEPLTDTLKKVYFVDDLGIITQSVCES